MWYIVYRHRLELYCPGCAIGQIQLDGCSYAVVMPGSFTFNHLSQKMWSGLRCAGCKKLP